MICSTSGPAFAAHRIPDVADLTEGLATCAVMEATMKCLADRYTDELTEQGDGLTSGRAFICGQNTNIAKNFEIFWKYHFGILSEIAARHDLLRHVADLKDRVTDEVFKHVEAVSNCQALMVDLPYEFVHATMPALVQKYDTQDVSRKVLVQLDMTRCGEMERNLF